MKRIFLLAFTICLVFSTSVSYSQKKVVNKIIEIGTTDNQSMKHLDVLCNRFGGRLIDAVVFLESLASKEDTVFATQEIDTIKAISEEVIITETITRDANLRTITESVTITEAIVRTNYTPPFEYGPAGSPQGVWNSSEWG